MAGGGSWHRVAVVLVLVLAGCSATPGPDGTETATVTPAPIPEAQGFAPGVTGGGLNASSLLAAHKEQLQNRSYTLTTTLTVRNRSTRAVQWRERSVVRVAEGTTALSVTTTYSEPRATDGVVRMQLYYDGTTTRRSVTADGSVTVQRFEHRTNVDPTNADLLGNVFFQLTDVRVRHGTGDATVVSGTLRYPRLLPTPPSVRARGRATVTASLRGSGLVERLAVGYDAGSADRPAQVRLTSRVTDLGTTTVERPAWLTNASG